MISNKRSPLQTFLVGLFIVSMILLYVDGALKQLYERNLDMVSTDQSAYMNYGRQLRESGYTFIGGRNRMPMFPLLLSVFYRPGMSDDAYFVMGKTLNLVLSLFLLVGLMAILRRYLSKFMMTNILLITMFSVFMFKASFVQTELLFYFVNFSIFVLMWKMLVRPTYRLGILTGIVTGLGHLTKASVLPALALFLGFALLKWGWHTWQTRRGKSLKEILAPTSSILLVVLLFLVTIFPYIRTSKRVFGHYFYNVNSTFYIWNESWDDVVQSTRAHGDRVGWPDMPEEDIPSFSKYMREHTFEQILYRFTSGWNLIVESVTDSYGYHIFVLIFVGALLIATIWQRERAWQVIMDDPFRHLFLLAYFVAHLTLYSWYAWITSGNRFVLAQFIPLMYTIAMGLETLLSSIYIKLDGQRVRALLLFNMLIFIFTMANILFVWSERIVYMYGGS